MPTGTLLRTTRSDIREDTMKTSASIRLRSLPVRTVRLCIALAALLLGSSVASAQAPTLHGVWAQVITPRDCATNEPLPVPPFRVLLTFHRDGTVTESVGALSFAPGQRSIGHGKWAHDGGLTFSERTVAMILFNGGIYQAGWQVTTRTLTMSDADHYTSSGAAQFYDVNRQQYRAACATSVGERFQ
jgi:hypothetical protein